jgi:glycosyltransferase involved in cell wall biosynthesis
VTHTGGVTQPGSPRRPGPAGRPGSSKVHLGLAATLPPAPTGPAEFVAGALPELARACTVTCFVTDPAGVDPALRERFTIRPLAERDDPSIDLVLYHIANNLHQVDIYDAAMAGPPGLLEIHDGSVHHTLATRMLASDDVDAYRHLLARTHGPRGDQLARLRLGGQPAGIELFMFDALKDLLDAHLGVVVHNRYAADLIALRAPELPVWVVPHPALARAPSSVDRESLGLPTGTLLIAHFGFITPPKRPYLLLDAFSRLRAAGVNCHLLFAGRDDTSGELKAAIERFGLAGDVTVTGYLTREAMSALLGAADIVVGLRFPHVGESSGTLAAALGAGRCVVVQETGSWAELPEAAVVRVPASGDEVTALAEALGRLAADPEGRAALGAAARAYATESLGEVRYAASIAGAALAVSLGSRIPAARQVGERRDAVAAFLAGRGERLTTATLLAAGWPGGEDLLAVRLAALARVPPARTGGRLLDLGGSAALLRLLECTWGYEVERGTLEPGGRLGHGAGVFDAVTCWDLLPADRHEATGLLAEINRVLRPQGVAVLMTTALGDLALSRVLPEAGLSNDGLTVVDAEGNPTTVPGPVVGLARKVGLPALADRS